MRSLFVCASLAAMSSGLAGAQSPESAETEPEARQDEILVQAARRDIPAEALPNTIRLIDQTALSEQILISTNLIDMIGTQVPSFSPSRQKLSGVGESFRGREPLYLIDGVPQSNPLRNGSRDGFTIDPAVIERVEVLYGANAIQGVGATGGVINYVTLDPAEKENWELRVEAGITASNDFDGDGYGYRGGATALRDFGEFDLVASFVGETRGAFYDGDGRRIGVDGTQGDIQDSVSTNLFLKGGWDIDQHTRLQLTANLLELEGDGDYVQVAGDRSTGLPTSSARGDTEGEPPTNTVNTFSADFTREELFGGTLTAQAFYREFESVFGGGTFGGFFNTGEEAPGEETFDQSANNSNKTGLKLTYSLPNLPVEGMTLTGGLDYLSDETYQELIQTGRLWVPEVEFESLAPFLQVDQLLLEDRLLISFGARQENAALKVDDYTTIFSSGSTEVAGGEPDFTETLLNIGTSFEVIDGLTAYAAFSEGFTMPDVGRVLRAVSTPGQDVDTLLDIEPIIADNTELGMSVSHGGFSANASYFWSSSDLGQRLVANEVGIFEVRREPTEIEGFEIAAEYLLDNGMLFGANYASLEGQSDQDGDGRIDEDLSAENISPDRLNLFVSAEPITNVSVRAQISHLFDRAFNDEGSATDFEGYSLVDLSAGYQTEQFGRFDLGLQNALNEDYTTYYSQSSPNAASRDDRFFAGRGRTFTLRWSATY
ncbi:MAG: TonB-dependent receptor [Henriciella sp.]|nr:TonB-dependent receptor [Henriciella sp.]